MLKEDSSQINEENDIEKILMLFIQKPSPFKNVCKYRIVHTNGQITYADKVSEIWRKNFIISHFFIEILFYNSKNMLYYVCMLFTKKVSNGIIY